MTAKQWTDEQVRAAARVVYTEGLNHGWWGASAPAYEELDQIGREEFDEIIDRALRAAATAVAVHQAECSKSNSGGRSV